MHNTTQNKPNFYRFFEVIFDGEQEHNVPSVLKDNCRVQIEDLSQAILPTMAEDNDYTYTGDSCETSNNLAVSAKYFEFITEEEFNVFNKLFPSQCYYLHPDEEKPSDS